MRRNDDAPKVLGCVSAVLVLAVSIVLLAIIGPRGCTDTAGATRVLTNAGYKDVEITGWRPLMADKGDAFSTGFRATSPTGQRVTGAVTSSWFKGNTIRFD